MKLNIQALTAAVVLSCAGAANAAIDGFSTGNGELFLSVRDNTAATSIVLDMNTTVDAFLGTAGAPSGNFSLTNAAVANFMSAGSGDYSWAVMAGDSTGGAVADGLRYLSTTNAADTTIGSIKNGVFAGFSTMEGAYLDNINPFIGAGETLESTSLDNSYFKVAFDSWSNNAPFSATAAAGTSQNFMYLSNTGNPAFLGTNLPIAYSQLGTFTLSTTGALDYAAVSAVPLPAAVYFLGSALVGLVGVARRKKKVV